MFDFTNGETRKVEDKSRIGLRCDALKAGLVGIVGQTLKLITLILEPL